ncbi:hypothetical protein VUR80DRAFT_4066 [Thermomyces stellatus]
MAQSPNSKKRQREDSPANGEEPLSDKAIEELAKAGAAFDTDRVPKRQRVEATRSLFVRSLPPSATNESLTEFFSQHYPVKHSIVVLDQKTKTSRGYGFVTFADVDDAKEAKEKLNGVEWEGRKLRLDVAEPRHRAKDPKVVLEVDSEKEKRKAMLEEARRPAKLIVRNLPWSVKKPEHLAALFQSFGKVKYADLPNTNGKLKGFGFVTMRKRKHAQKALETVNGKQVDGRTLAVDWAVDKQTWEAQAQQETKPSSEESKEKRTDAKEEAIGKKVESKDEPKAKTKSSEKESTPTADEDVAAFFANHMDNLESESDSDDVDEEEDFEEEDEDDERSSQREKAESQPAKKLTTDTSSTVFIRNLPYTVTDEQLKDFFKRFGPVRYARVVMDKATDRPAGTGFVCFVKQEDCKSCVRGAPRQQSKPLGASNITHSVLYDETVDPEGKYTLDGRILQVAQAVSKDETARFSKDGNKNKDKRRLFLLSEGVITKSSPLYTLLSPAEIKMREASLAQRKKLVQSNPTLHLSLTRLAIRNIPRNMTQKDLKELGRKAVVGFAVDVKEGRREPLSREEKARGGEEAKAAERERKLKNKGVVKQAKLIFETKDGSKAPMTEGTRSRGYGFIEYWTHRSALMALRFLNGHQREDDRGKKHRLIAEFAIENAQVVNRRKTQQAKSREAARSKSETPAEPESSGKAQAERNAKDEGPRNKEKRVHKGPKADNRDGKGRKKERVQSKAERKEGRQDDVKQKLIARKRMIRKKKAATRS